MSACHLALGFEIGEQRKMQMAIAGKGRMAPNPSTEIPSNFASCL
jgi:hypothetical protein